MVLHVEHSCPETCRTDTLQRVYQETIAPASRAICDILATNVGIVRKACRGEKTHHRRAALSRQLAANRRRDQAQGKTLDATSVVDTFGETMYGPRGMHSPTMYAPAIVKALRSALFGSGFSSPNSNRIMKST